ncbi:MAG TPA: hypothetical protein GX527_01360 [Clostridiaceae bacterium]|jgi:hypothetical protein|nr:hypothetical protein [Clostridiaceae bacterium]
MDFENVRRIVVIKNVASNYIEEAIFILRSDSKVENNLLKKDRQLYGKLNNDKDYLIKEAQIIINNYIKECEKNGISYSNSNIHNSTIYNKKLLKSRLSINTIINIALFSSLAILLFFLVKVFF